MTKQDSLASINFSDLETFLPGKLVHVNIQSSDAKFLFVIKFVRKGLWFIKNRYNEDVYFSEFFCWDLEKKCLSYFSFYSDLHLLNEFEIYS